MLLLPHSNRPFGSLGPRIGIFRTEPGLAIGKGGIDVLACRASLRIAVVTCALEEVDQFVFDWRFVKIGTLS